MLEPREGAILTSTKHESEKAKEPELESDLDRMTPNFDDSHIYDEPLQCLQGRGPLPLPPDYKNVHTHQDAPPSYSSTVRFLQTTPLPNSAMLDGFLSSGTTSGQHEASDYSELDTDTMPRLEYGNIGQRLGDSEGSTLGTPDTIDYTNITPHATLPNAYARMPVVASLFKLSHDQPSCNINLNLSTSGGHPRAYETPGRKWSDYQPLLPGERIHSGEYTQIISPQHVQSKYDVPRGQNGKSASLVAEGKAGAPSTVPKVGGDKKERVNTESGDIQEYIEMASVVTQEQCSP